MTLSDSAKNASKIMAVGTALIWTAYIYLRISSGGTCHKPELQQDFDPDQYLGTWYELRRDERIPYESGECVTA